MVLLTEISQHSSFVSMWRERVSRKPSHLSYTAKDGVYTSFLPGKEQAQALHRFVEDHLSWYDEGGPVDYRLLDTFLSDAISLPILSRVVAQLKSRGGKLQVLLVSPDSAFGCARAEAIGVENPKDELFTGVSALRKALEDHGLLPHRPVSRSETALSELVPPRITAQSTKGEPIDIEFRFYRIPPSAPMYFFDDILITSRFSYGSSSTANPWWLIVDEEQIEDDLYNSYRNEFEAVWGKAVHDPISSGVPRLMRKVEQRTTVLAVRVGADITERGLYAYAEQLSPLWEAVGTSKVLRSACGEVSITPWTDGVVAAFLDSKDACLPLELAYDLFDRYGHKFDLRYAIVRGGLVLVQTGPFMKHWLGAANDLVGSLSRRVDSQCVALSEEYYKNYVHEPEHWGVVEDKSRSTTDLTGDGYQYRVLCLRPRGGKPDTRRDER